jgi:hypothetical protein
MIGIHQDGLRNGRTMLQEKGICGADNVPLVRERVPDDMTAAGFKTFTYLGCPRSGQVLNDEAENS